MKWRLVKVVTPEWESDETLSLYKEGEEHPFMGNPRYYPYVPEDEADWCLMAAAPDMLEALKAARGSLLDVDELAFRQVSAAIAKAEGRA
jgi:hypothetical protein